MLTQTTEGKNTFETSLFFLHKIYLFASVLVHAPYLLRLASNLEPLCLPSQVVGIKGVPTCRIFKENIYQVSTTNHLNFYVFYPLKCKSLPHGPPTFQSSTVQLCTSLFLFLEMVSCHPHVAQADFKLSLQLRVTLSSFGLCPHT